MTIICGYQGSGKSTYCKVHPTTTIDLDSSAWVKESNWEKNYIDMALTFSNMHKKVFVSAHKQVIEYMIQTKIDFQVLAPTENKNAWRSRLEFRYYQNPILPNLKAIKDFEQNYDNDMKYYKDLENRGVKVLWVQAKVITNIEDLLK